MYGSFNGSIELTVLSKLKQRNWRTLKTFMLVAATGSELTTIVRKGTLNHLAKPVVLRVSSITII